MFIDLEKHKIELTEKCMRYQGNVWCGLGREHTEGMVMRFYEESEACVRVGDKNCFSLILA